MAFWGGGGSGQIIRIPRMSFARGRSVFSISAWAVIPSLSSFVSLLRQNQTIVPLQVDTNNGGPRVAHWDSGEILRIGSAVVTSPVNEWALYVASYGPPGVVLHLYRPSLGTVVTSAAFPHTGPLRTTPTASFEPFCIGGSETGVELMPSGFAVAEVACWDRYFVARDVRRLATNPASLREQMAVYIPLRGPSMVTEPARFGRFAMQFGTESRAAFRPNQHPPVPLLGDF